MSRIASLFCIALTAFACGKEPAPEPFPEPELLLRVPDGFPDPIFPEGNELTEARWTLGKKLFFDPVLSRDSSISCASCHLPAFAFSDTTAFSPGVDGAPGKRNSPSLANVAYHPYLLREGGVPTLEMQILVPIQEHNEFDFNILLIAERLQRDSLYRAMSQGAYGREPDHFVITRAIACFERTLLSGGSAYDRDELPLSAERGRQLFFGEKTQCSECHGGFNFTHYAFENNGLYEEYADPGRFRLTSLEEDRALFKVPSLRNVALTAPYMHDGSIPTLGAVMAHYNSGGAAHPHKSPLIRPLGLSAQERADLVAFLESLTDEAFVNNPLFRP